MFNANSFKIFCWLPLLAACQSPAAALPHGETSETVALDAKHHVAVQRYCAGPPIAGVLFSVLLMGEALTSRLLAGFALIFLSIILSETHFDFLRRKSRPQL